MMKRIGFAVLAVLMSAGVAGAHEATPISVEAMPPSVVATAPQAGDMDVDPALEAITVTFSKDMQTENMWSVCAISEETFPETGEGVHYLDDNRTCVVPVTLEPEKSYALWFNTGEYDSFRDTGNNPAVPYLLVFRTGKAR